MNRVMLIGRLARDPELRYTTGGVAVASLVMAVGRGPGTNGREADFLNVVVWNKAGEVCAQYLGKGRQLGVEGRLHSRFYEDKYGGRRKSMEVVADKIYFLDRPRQEKEDVPADFRPIEEDMEGKEEEVNMEQ